MVVDLDQLLAALADEILAEPVTAEHLEQEAPEIPQPLLTEAEQGAALAAQHTGGRD